MKKLFIFSCILFSAPYNTVFSEDRMTTNLNFDNKNVFAITLRPMIIASDTMGLPFPVAIDFHAKMFADISVGVGYSFVIDDVPFFASRKIVEGYTGNIKNISVRYHPSTQFSGFFWQHSFELINWEWNCRRFRDDCTELDYAINTDRVHVTFIGYGRSSKFFYSSAISHYQSILIGRSWSENVRNSKWNATVEFGLLFNI